MILVWNWHLIFAMVASGQGFSRAARAPFYTARQRLR
jgi:hypothetical protein